MATVEFRLPDVGEGIDAADLLEWKVQEGEAVREHDILVEIQTDKAVMDIPSPATGTLVRHGAAAGETLAVGAVLAVLETATAEPGDAPPAPETAPEAEPAAAPAPTGAEAVTRRALAAPATRRLAREAGVDLQALQGSGPHGRILREDVERADRQPSSVDGAGDGRAPTAGEVVPLRGLRRSIARSLTHAWQTVPHVTDYREVDARALLEARDALREDARRQGDDALATALTPTPLLVKIAASALARHPYVNASIDLEREEITLHAQRSIGVATATPEGLVVPVVHDADGRSIEEIAREVDRLTAVARQNRLRPEDLAGGTFTVNNYGGLGIWLGTPIVKPPEVANLGVGAIRDQVVVHEGQPVVRPTLALAVSADHRVLDGHTLAAFVTDVVRLIERPALLLGGLR
jgi:pyruvate/2-oxoglutarate dehydrogenase complex dihydrolipoamide acyltransferase (E2) component